MYLDHFGLKTNPFGISHRLDFVYKSGAFEESMAHLVYGLDNSEAIVMITGAIGTGKTMAVQSFFAHLGERYVTALVTNTRVDAKELLKLVLEDLGAPAPMGSDKSDLLIAFKKFLVSLGREGKRIVIVIDEAQNLSLDVLEEIRLLTNIGQGDEQPVQIILVGQPELARAVEQPELAQLRQRIRVHYQLSTLSRRELEEYVDHRMRVAGGQAGVFSGAVLDRIFAASGGVPRVVNTMAGNALLAAYVDGRKRVEASDLDESAPGTQVARDPEPAAAREPEWKIPPVEPRTGAPRPGRADSPADGMAVRRAPTESKAAEPEKAKDPESVPSPSRRWMLAVVLLILVGAVAVFVATGGMDRLRHQGAVPVASPVAAPAKEDAVIPTGAPAVALVDSAAAAADTSSIAATVDTGTTVDSPVQSQEVAIPEPIKPDAAAKPAPKPVVRNLAANAPLGGEVAAKAQESKASDPATNDYYIHVSSFKTVEHAETVARTYADKGLPAVVRALVVQEVEWFRVYLGPYATHAEAVRRAEEMKAGGTIQYSQVARLDVNGGS